MLLISINGILIFHQDFRFFCCHKTDDTSFRIESVDTDTHLTLRMKTEPVTAGADAMVYISGLCIHILYVYVASETRHIPLLLLDP